MGKGFDYYVKECINRKFVYSELGGKVIMEGFGLVKYFQALVKRKWLIIIILILTSLSSFLVSKYLIKPTYSATVTLIVGSTQASDKNKPIDYNDLMFYDKIISTYSKVLQSNNILNDVVKKLSFDTSVDNIKSNLSVTTKQGTLIINVTTEDQSAERAMQISNQVSKSFINKVTAIMQIKQNVNILDLAEVPKAPSFPNLTLNTLVAFLIGLILSMFIVFILEYLDNTLKSPEDVKRYIDLPVIGVIPSYNGIKLEKGERINEDN